MAVQLKHTLALLIEPLGNGLVTAKSSTGTLLGHFIAWILSCENYKTSRFE